MISRRSFLTAAISLIAAPAIVRATSLMPVKAWVDDPRIAEMAKPASGQMYRFLIVTEDGERHEGTVRPQTYAQVLTTIKSPTIISTVALCPVPLDRFKAALSDWTPETHRPCPDSFARLAT
jgi:hypothetical protein